MRAVWNIAFATTVAVLTDGAGPSGSSSLRAADATLVGHRTPRAKPSLDLFAGLQTLTLQSQAEAPAPTPTPALAPIPAPSPMPTPALGQDEPQFETAPVLFPSSAGMGFDQDQRFWFPAACGESSDLWSNYCEEKMLRHAPALTEDHGAAEGCCDGCGEKRRGLLEMLFGLRWWRLCWHAKSCCVTRPCCSAEQAPAHGAQEPTPALSPEEASPESPQPPRNIIPSPRSTQSTSTSSAAGRRRG